MGRRRRDVMTTEVVTVDEETPFRQVGVVSEADLMLREEFPEGPPEGQLFEGRRRRAARTKTAGATAVLDPAGPLLGIANGPLGPADRPGVHGPPPFPGARGRSASTRLPDAIYRCLLADRRGGPVTRG